MKPQLIQLAVAMLMVGCRGAAPAPGPVQPHVVQAEPAPASPLQLPAPAAKPADVGPVPAACSAPSASQVAVDLKLPRATLERLFPIESKLPWPYNAPGEQSRVPATLQDSIQTFLTSSLKRDGFTEISIHADVGAARSSVSISATGCNLADYQTQLPRFLAAGVLGLASWDRCVQKGVCKDKRVQHRCATGDKQCSPWAFYLPLGLPLVNHSSVMYLDYPPSDALCGADYLNNFTMNRWAQIYAWQHVDSASFGPLVDVHPIAADGSGESSDIKLAGPYFTDYSRAMLQVLATPPNLTQRPGVDHRGRTLAILVSGGPAQLAWSALLDVPDHQTIKSGDIGTTDRLVEGSQTAWVASNHPTVTAYQACAKDPKSVSSGFGNSWDLVADERLDFRQACLMRLVAANPADPFAQRAECEALVDSMVTERCAQARLDYTFTSDGNCYCPKAATAFCDAHQQQACPNGDAGPYLTCSDSNAAAGCPQPQPHAWFRCARTK